MALSDFLKPDNWVKYNQQWLCFNPTPPNVYNYKIGIYKHITGARFPLFIFYNMKALARIIDKTDFSVLIVTPKRIYDNVLKEDIAEAGLAEQITIVHQAEFTKAYNKNELTIHQKQFDFIYIPEEVTLRWLKKKGYILSANYAFITLLSGDHETLESIKYLGKNIIC